MPNKSKLGVYLAPTHNPEAWKRYLFEIDPGVVRILMPGDSPTQVVSDVYHLCPEAEISLRWWDLDDGGEENKRRKLSGDVAGNARADVQEMVKRVETMQAEASRKGLPFPQRTQIWFNTLNEPPTWEGNEARKAIVDYNCNFIAEAAKFSFGTMAGEFAVGHPHEWPPEWEWFDPVLDLILRHQGLLALHEYWQPEGPHYVWTDEQGRQREDWKALAGRYLHLAREVPIVITECGEDGRIFNRHATPHTGYQKFMDAEAYAAQLAQYLAEVKKDSRILSVLPFITDFANKEWASFDTLPAKDAIVRELEKLNETGGSGFSVHIPVVHRDGDDSEQDSSVDDGVDAVVIDPHVARAILEVESNGSGFASDGRLKIRFEAHIFERYIDKTRFDRHFRYDPLDILSAWYRLDQYAPWLKIHVNQSSEHAAFEVARKLNSKAAHMSISMGAAQIMGFNHARVGFATPEAMYKAFAADGVYHLIAFYNFVLGDKGLVDAIIAKDWREIARRYNGSLLVDIYSARLSQAYSKLTSEKGNAK